MLDDDDEPGEPMPTNVFDRSADIPVVPVTIEIDGEKKTVGEAALWTGDDGFVYANMTLKTDDPEDVRQLFGNGITGVSIAEAAPDISSAEAEALMEFQAHDHKPVQHRDGRAPWCAFCGLSARMDEPKGTLSDVPPQGHFGKPKSPFNFGKPANDIHKGE